MADTQTNQDDQWQQAYDNAAESLFPQAFDPANSAPLRQLTWEEDDACIKIADATIAELEA